MNLAHSDKLHDMDAQNFAQYVQMLLCIRMVDTQKSLIKIQEMCAMHLRTGSGFKMEFSIGIALGKKTKVQFLGHC